MNRPVLFSLTASTGRRHPSYRAIRWLLATYRLDWPIHSALTVSTGGSAATCLLDWPVFRDETGRSRRVVGAAPPVETGSRATLGQSRR